MLKSEVNLVHCTERDASAGKLSVDLVSSFLLTFHFYSFPFLSKLLRELLAVSCRQQKK